MSAGSAFVALGLVLIAWTVRPLHIASAAVSPGVRLRASRRLIVRGALGIVLLLGVGTFLFLGDQVSTLERAANPSTFPLGPRQTLVCAVAAIGGALPLFGAVAVGVRCRLLGSRGR